MSANETTNDAFSSEALASTRDPSPLQMDADTFYHLGMHGGGTGNRLSGRHSG